MIDLYQLKKALFDIRRNNLQKPEPRFNAVDCPTRDINVLCGCLEAAIKEIERLNNAEIRDRDLVSELWNTTDEINQ